MTHGTATDSLTPLNFRHRESRKKMLEAYAHEDGERELSPILRNAVDLYIHLRQRFGADAVSMDRLGAEDHRLVGR